MFKRQRILSGMETFTTIWAGQFVSVLGTAMVRFALLIWLFQTTSKATDVALLAFFSNVPFILLSPLAGVIIDRVDRKWIMILSDCFAGLMTLILLIINLNGGLAPWHLYLAEGVASVMEAFQIPAFVASISLLVPKEQYGRTSGMRSLSESTSSMIGPIAGGALLGIIGLNGLMIIDLLAVGVAVFTLLRVTIPRPEQAMGQRQQEIKFSDLSFGFDYIRQRKTLLMLLLITLLINLSASLTYNTILPSMVLARSHENSFVLSMVQAALGGRGRDRRVVNQFARYTTKSFGRDDDWRNLIICPGRFYPRGRQNAPGLGSGGFPIRFANSSICRL